MSENEIDKLFLPQDRTVTAERNFVLYTHVNDSVQIEGCFSSCVEIDKYMDWKKGTAKRIEETDCSRRYSIISEGDEE